MSSLPEYNSILSELIEGYISMKRAIGYKFQKEMRMLKTFDRFVQTFNLKEIALSKEVVNSWMQRTPNETVRNQSNRISIVRGFTEYMNRLSYTAYIPPKGFVTVKRYSYLPYIFSNQEIRLILTECDNFPPSDLSPNRHLILPLIIRMLYSCGLRISEAVNLKIADVDFNNGTIFISNTKFNKQRIIPMADSLTKRCREYRQVVLLGRSEESPVFPSPYGGCYASYTIYKLFREVLWKAKISHTGKGPRLHDIRHTFAVHCLKQWVIEGKNLSNCLPYLSIYLGHEDMRGTQRYLRLTADLYPDIISKVEESCSWLIPEVTLNETD